LPSSTTSTSLKRAVGVVRVSRVGGRDGEQFVSPSEQRQRIEAACGRDGLVLVETIEELDVSGGAPLERRPGLRRAVELVEAGEVDVVVVAYLDRLVRSLAVQAEVVNRVEQAGGAIMAVDIGALTSTSAGQWLSGTMLGAVSEYARRVTAERTADAKRRAVDRGVPPFPNVPPGYQRRDDGTLAPHPTEAPVVTEAFRLRAAGATVMEVRDYLRRNGIERSFHGTTSLLASRVVLGELHFGKLANLNAQEPLIDAQTWGRVQRMKSPRGRRAKSERLLARLGVLRCGTCGARMVVGTANHGAYRLYRCPPIGDCPRRVTISAEVAERAVVDATRELLAGMAGTASMAEGVTDAERKFAAAEQELDAAVRAFTGLEDVDAARERLAALHEARDQTRDRLAEIQAAAAPAVTITARGDWDLLTLEEQRALITAVIDRATVAPGRGANRITIEPRS
jgi:DNA invertase Pin-like site-specific DNA recombinase